VEEEYREYLHTPSHLFRPHAIYLVTGATYRKRPLLNTDDKLARFQRILFERSSIAGWTLEAWAILPNHYHFIARSPLDPKSLSSMIRAVHSISGKHINSLDNIPGRRVWYNYWDTCITSEGSYLARLHYVHTNPVKHNIVEEAKDYPFCSYQWFMVQAEADFYDRVFSQPIDTVNVRYDFD
jgi:putative transposase